MLTAVAVFLAQAQSPSNLPTSQPDPTHVPLNGFIVQAVHSLEWIALIAALVGLLISAGFWAAGAYSNNYQQVFNGKRGVAISAVAAIIIGLAPYLLNLLYSNASSGGASGG